MITFHTLVRQFFLPKDKKCTVFRVNVPYFYASVPGMVHRMLAGLIPMQMHFLESQLPNVIDRNVQIVVATKLS